jgi:hypothetical protein
MGVARWRLVALASLIAFVAVLAGLIALNASNAEQHGSAAQSRAPQRSRPPSASVGITKVLVVIEENHSYEQMKSGMPFLSGLSDKYGYARHWKAITHPSEPNYLAIAGGSTFGIADDQAPSAHYSEIGNAHSVFDQALDAGRTAATYAESMPENCHVWDYPDRAVGSPLYAVRHNPWVYFQGSRAACTSHDLPLSSFRGDAVRNALPNVGFLIPNLCNDAHNCGLAAADQWLSDQLGPVLASADFRTGKLVVVVTADEDDKHSGNTVLTSVLTPRLSGKVVDRSLTHYSLTRFIADVLGVSPLGRGATAPDMTAAFGL